jgi:hypothetical protein
LFLCVAASAAAIQVPSYMFMDAAVKRMATLQSPEEVEALVAKHEPHGFWRCRDDEFRVRANLRADVERDLGRYGLRTDFRTVPDDTAICEQEASQPGRPPRRVRWLLLAWEGSDVPGRVRLGRWNTVPWFEGRIRNMQAAQQYARGTGPFASLLALQWQVATALGAALLATLLAATSRHRARGLANVPRLAKTYSWRLTFRFDEYVAARWPTIWASRVHRSLLQVLVASVVVGWLLFTGMDLFRIAVLGVGVLALVAPHAGAALPQAGVRQDVGVLVIHAGLFVAIAMVTVPVLYAEAIGAALHVSAWAAMIACGWVQAARVGSIYTAFGALALTLLPLVVVGFVGTGAQHETMLVNLLVTAAFGGLVWWAFRLQGRFTLRRLVVGALFIQVGHSWASALLVVSPKAENLAFPGALLALYLASMAAVLYFSQNGRRVLAAAPR